MSESNLGGIDCEYDKTHKCNQDKANSDLNYESLSNVSSDSRLTTTENNEDECQKNKDHIKSPVYDSVDKELANLLKDNHSSSENVNSSDQVNELEEKKNYDEKLGDVPENAPGEATSVCVEPSGVPTEITEAKKEQEADNSIEKDDQDNSDDKLKSSESIGDTNSSHIESITSNHNEVSKLEGENININNDLKSKNGALLDEENIEGKQSEGENEESWEDGTHSMGYDGDESETSSSVPHPTTSSNGHQSGENYSLYLCNYPSKNVADV